MSRAYYNEYDPFAAAWLRNLIAEHLIAPGDVDERSIAEVRSTDLAGYTQCHFFAGIGGWSLALRLAGWPDDRPVWTGSCPCQPFSVAGRNQGVADPRHLWPVWFPLIRECGPDVVFGEQVEAAITHGWLDLIQADLEGSGYAVGAVGVPAAGVGAYHQRHRLWWVGDRAQGRQRVDRGTSRGGGYADQTSAINDLADPRRGPNERRGGSREARGEGRGVEGTEDQREWGGVAAGAGVSSRGVADDNEARRDRQRCSGLSTDGDTPPRYNLERRGGTSGPDAFWSRVDWIPCRDGRYRPVEPGTFPLAHGVPARVGRLRGYGNAIVPQVAAEVIAAYMEMVDSLVQTEMQL